MHLSTLIVDLALLLGVAAVMGLIFRRLKQPVVLGYLLAGILVGPEFTLLPTVRDPENIKIWAELGVIFLLFVLGLEFSFKQLFRVGRPALVAATVEVFAMVGLGATVALLLGWSRTEAIYLGAILAISSTTIIVKAFQEQGIKTQSFATLVYGILIIEDLYAILILAMLSALSTAQSLQGSDIFKPVWTLLLFLLVTVPLGLWLFPRILKYLRDWLDDESRVIVSLALCLGLVVTTVMWDLSPALGAFLMGAFLGETLEGERVERFLKPIRDLFGAIFFTSIGMLVSFEQLGSEVWLIALLSVITITGKVLFTWLGAVMGGQDSRTALQAGLSLGQIGEFSFIIATLGLNLQVISPKLYPLAVAIALITTFATPYLIQIGTKLQSMGFLKFAKIIKPRLWNGHLVEFEIHPHFQHAGEVLQEIKLRERFGVSLVAIWRGERKILAPTRSDRLMPFDRVVVHGTDLQLARLEKFFSSERYSVEHIDENQFVLEGIRVREDHRFCGKRIRESGIREQTHGLILGIERHDQKLLNPDSSVLLLADDILWIYGRRERLKRISR